jgi:hypothetical protein
VGARFVLSLFAMSMFGALAAGSTEVTTGRLINVVTGDGSGNVELGDGNISGNGERRPPEAAPDPASDTDGPKSEPAQ